MEQSEHENLNLVNENSEKNPEENPVGKVGEKRKFISYLPFIIPPLIALVILGLVISQRETSHSSSPDPAEICGEQECVVVNGKPVYNVLYHGRLIPISEVKNIKQPVDKNGKETRMYQSIAPLSAYLGYYWMFDTEEEGKEFDEALIKLEENCWVPGTCMGKLDAGEEYEPWTPEPSDSPKVK